MPNSWWSRMIKSQALQRTTPSSAGIGPSSTRRARNALCSFVSLPGAPGDTLLMRPSGPYSLNRITQSRSVCRSMPPVFAASCRADGLTSLEVPFAKLVDRERPPGVDPDGQRYCGLNCKACQLRSAALGRSISSGSRPRPSTSGIWFR